MKKLISKKEIYDLKEENADEKRDEEEGKRE